MKPLAELLAANPLPRPSGGKDDKGTVVVIGGPLTCPGAAVLAGTAALCTGAGRVQLCVDPSVATEIGVAIPEAAVFGWDLRSDPAPAVKDVIAGADVVLIGVGHRQLSVATVQAIAAGTDATLLLDAGALDAALGLADAHTVVIAPNTSEAAALMGVEESAEEELAVAVCAALGQPVAVRGAIAVVAAAEGAWSYDALPEGLGTPGSGDVFAGALAALVANGCKAAPALGWATRLHADAARHLAAQTPVGYLARDVARQLPRALAEHCR
jgi:NAD(P)H-hydrate repair Nnr-like enzyme with NAD(P)H-hydrate dehydratase domain